MNRFYLSISWRYSSQFVLIFLLIFSTGANAQYKLNFGLSEPQDPTTLPISLVKPQSPVRKAKISIPAVLQKAGENEYLLSSGWEMAEADQVTAADRSIFSLDFNTTGWYNAIVPGTVLTTLVNQGVYPDPYFGLNNLSIPESLCRKNWWYRLPFSLPSNAAGKTIWLLFDGINYKADIWLNGKLLGKIAGAFERGEFDASEYLNMKGANILAVHIYPPNNPGIPHEESLKTDAGPNGGQLCLDGPTFISSEGWDWVPGIRDRNIGIWQDVRLRLTEAVTIIDPQVITDLPLPDTTSVAITVKGGIKNNSQKVQNVTVTGRIAEIEFSKKIQLRPNELKEISFLPTELSQLNLRNPKLWWPNGYGHQDLYNLHLGVKLDNEQVSDQKQVRFGVREFTYEMTVSQPDQSRWRVEFNPVKSAGKVMFNTIDRTDVGKGTFLPKLADSADASQLTSLDKNSDNPFLIIKVNGIPVFCKGGNWGMDDAMKRVTRERLEPAFKLHKEANFNMIRNWTGESTEEVFYNLCDEYGMLVWNDFWLSTEGYNLNVNDNQLFMANATEVVKRFRNHPSIAIWCPRNEGYAPAQLEPQLQKLIATEDGTRLYQPNSRNLNLRPSGPWRFYPNPADYSKDAEGFNTEVGLPSVPTAPSMRKMMAKEDVWPISDVWAYHDFHLGQKDYCNTIEKLYGKPESLEDFCKGAQLINYESHRAMFEAWNSKLWNKVSGVLLWMSHPAWPSTDWQVYSWDFETLGSYFGSKKACEPIHIQMNLHDKKVVIVNSTQKKYNKLEASIEYYNLNGKRLNSKKINIDVLANQLTYCLTADLTSGLPPVYLIRLSLSQGKNILSWNEYWQSTNPKGSFIDFNQLAEPHLISKVLKMENGKVSFIVSNPTNSTAIGLKFNLLDPESNRIVLPAYFSDGYFTLLPGEKRQMEVEWNSLDCNKVKVVVEGYTFKQQVLFETK
jgi:hypothetical protein